MFLFVRFWLGHLAYRFLALLTIVFTTNQIQQIYEIAWVFAYLVTVNIVTFLIYFFDKLIAPIGQMPLLKYIFNIRAPNGFLFRELGLLGGGIGAFYGIHLTRHKNSSEYVWWRRQLWLTSWLVFAGVAYLLWAAIISFAELNSLIGSVISMLINTIVWIVDVVEPLWLLIN